MRFSRFNNRWLQHSSGRMSVRSGVLLSLFACTLLQAGEIRLSFLNDSSALDSTLEFLSSKGCNEETIAFFRRAVEHYYVVPLNLDLTNFPPSENGFYSFHSMAQAVAALPHKLRDTPHAFELNCFDTVIILAMEHFRSSLGPDDIFGTSLSLQMTNSNGAWVALNTATARDAFEWSCPSWYRDASEGFIPPSWSDQRINLNAAIFRGYVLPSSTSEDNLPQNVLKTVSANWKRQQVMFPQNCQVVLCHEVRKGQAIFSTSHAGVLFESGRGYTFWEKDSGSGPFVRLDFDTRADLLFWLASKMDAPEPPGRKRFFATFNNTEIEELSVGQ